MRFHITMFIGILSGIALTIWVFIPAVRDLSYEWKVMLTAAWALTVGATIVGLASKAMDRDLKKK